VIIDGSELLHFGDFGASTGATISAWVKTTFAEVGSIFTIGRNTGQTALFNMITLGNGTIRYQYRTDNAQELNGGIYDSTASVNDGKWHNIVLIRDGNLFEIYIDGIVDKTGTDASSFGVMTTEYQTLGARRFDSGPSFSSSFFKGSVDELALWNRTLSSNEILKLYKRGALRLNLTARSCANADCSDGSDFVGPGGTSASAFENATGGTLNVTNNRYLQYRANFFTYDLNWTPKLFNVTFHTIEDAAGPEVNTSFNISLTGIRIKDIVNISANVTDDIGVSFCQIINNQSGFNVFTNVSVSGTSAQCSEAIEVTAPRDTVINFTIRVNDTANNFAMNDTIIKVANTIPTLNTLVGGAKELEPFNSSLVLYLDMDEWNGTYVKDRTNYSNDGLIVGANRSYGQLGWGMEFDGKKDYIDIGDPSDGSLDFGTDTDFTIAFWVKETISSSRPIIHKKSGSFSSISAGYTIWELSDDVKFAISDGTTNVNVNGGKIKGGLWHHVVATADRDGNLVIYRDGIERDSADISSIGNANNNQPLSFAFKTDNYFPGSLDEVKIWNIALSADEVAKLYSRGLGLGNITTQTPLAVAVNETNNTILDADDDVLFTAVDWWKGTELNATTGKPDDNGTLLFMTFDQRNLTGTVEDYSIFNNSGTITSLVFSNDSAMGQGSFVWDGVASQIIIPDTGNLRFGTSDISISYWFKCDVDDCAAGTTDGWNVYKRNTGSNVGFTFYVRNAGNLQCFFNDDVDSVSITTTEEFDDNQWHHAVCMRDGDTARLYVDNTELATGDASAVGDISDSSALILGKRAAEVFIGLMDEVRIYNHSLSPTEISQHYWAGVRKGLTLNQSQTKKNENWNATVTLYDSAPSASASINFSFQQIEDTIATISLGINNSNPKINEVVNVSANVTDADGLSFCLIKTNQTGAFTNNTFALSGTSGFCSDPITISVKRGNVINFTVEVNDTVGDVIYESSTKITVANTIPTLTTIVGGAKELEPFNSSLVLYIDMDDWNASYVKDRTNYSNDGLCVAEDSLITMSDGSKKKIKDVKAGEHVQSLDEKTGKLVTNKIKALLDMGNKTIYELTTVSGRAVNTTATHPYLVKLYSKELCDKYAGDVWNKKDAINKNNTFNNNSVKNENEFNGLNINNEFEERGYCTRWVEVKDLTENMEIAVPRIEDLDKQNIQSSPLNNLSINSLVVNTLTPDCCLRCGSLDQIATALIANASARYGESFGSSGKDFIASISRDSYSDDLKNLIDSLTSDSLISNSCSDNFDLDRQSSLYLLNSDLTYSVVENSTLSEENKYDAAELGFIIENKTLLSTTKFILIPYFNSSSLFSGEILERILSLVSGEISESNFLNEPFFAFLPNSTDHLVNSFSSLESSFLRNASSSDFLCVLTSNSSIIKCSSLSTFFNFSIINESFTIASAILTSQKSYNENDYLKVSDESDIEFIKSIKVLEKQQVYDLEIENTHNFIANDIIAHNTFGANRSYGKLGWGMEFDGEDDKVTVSADATFENSMSLSSETFK